MEIQKFLSSSPVLNLIYFAQRTSNSINDHLKPHGLNHNQAMILIALFFEKSPVSPLELARALKMTKANLSHCLAALESQKLIKRTIGKRDARRFEIELTITSKKKVLNLISFFETQQHRIEQTWGVSEVQTFIERLNSLHELAGG